MIHLNSKNIYKCTGCHQKLRLTATKQDPIRCVLCFMAKREYELVPDAVRVERGKG